MGSKYSTICLKDNRMCAQMMTIVVSEILTNIKNETITKKTLRRKKNNWLMKLYDFFYSSFDKYL